jgi:hypothetical protein
MTAWVSFYKYRLVAALRRQPSVVDSSHSHNSLGSKVVSLTTSRSTISIQVRFSLSKRFKFLHLYVINNLSSPLLSSMCVRQTSFCRCLGCARPRPRVMWCAQRYGPQRVIARSRTIVDLACLFVVFAVVTHTPR